MIPKKNPSQIFRYKKGMEVLSGGQFSDHMAHLRTEQESVGTAKPGTPASPNKQ